MSTSRGERKEMMVDKRGQSLSTVLVLQYLSSSGGQGVPDFQDSQDSGWAV